MAFLMVAALFASAGRLAWPHAWIFVAFLLGMQLILTVVLVRRRPDLLVERSELRAGTASWDKWLVAFVALIGPLLTWVAAGLEVRLSRSREFPAPVYAIALGLAAAGYVLALSAMAANRFFSTTVRLQKERGHAVCDSGPYRVIRHPGYAGSAVFTLCTPVLLDSSVAFLPAVATVAVLLLRTVLEDRFLRVTLDGYQAYTGRVRYRLAPGIW